MLYINIYSTEFKKPFFKFFKNPSYLLKPTLKFIKKKIFDWIGPLNDLNCIDLFAGTGSLGIEAVLRGCKSCTFLEKNKKIFYLLKKNILSLGFKNVRLFNCNFFYFLNNFNIDLYDIIFFDSPYLVLNNLIDFIDLFINKLKINSKIYIESIFNLETLTKYFFKKIKILNYNFFKKINFTLFKVI